MWSITWSLTDAKNPTHKSQVQQRSVESAQTVWSEEIWNRGCRKTRCCVTRQGNTKYTKQVQTRTKRPALLKLHSQRIINTIQCRLSQLNYKLYKVHTTDFKLNWHCKLSINVHANFVLNNTNTIYQSALCVKCVTVKMWFQRKR